MNIWINVKHYDQTIGDINKSQKTNYGQTVGDMNKNQNKLRQNGWRYE